MAVQFQKAMEKLSQRNGPLHLVTMSAGNYGKSFAMAANQMGIKATVLMPNTAPETRVVKLKEQGAYYY